MRPTSHSTPRRERRHTSTTLEIETRSDVARLALAPDGRLLVAIDVDGCGVAVKDARGDGATCTLRGGGLSLAGVVDAIERARARLYVHAFSVSVVSLEEVFAALARRGAMLRKEAYDRAT